MRAKEHLEVLCVSETELIAWVRDFVDVPQFLAKTAGESVELVLASLDQINHDLLCLASVLDQLEELRSLRSQAAQRKQLSELVRLLDKANARFVGSRRQNLERPMHRISSTAPARTSRM